jgi:hypothetical protein
MRQMFDSVNARAVCQWIRDHPPTGPYLVAGYIDGPGSQWADSDWALPEVRAAAAIVTIATNPAHIGADVLDTEPGDATPAQLVGWTVAVRAAARIPTAYWDLSSDAAVRAAFAAAGVAPPQWWAAGYRTPRVAYLQPGSIATQWTDWGPVDESLVADYWPGIDPESENPMATLDQDDLNAIGTVVAAQLLAAFNNGPGPIGAAAAYADALYNNQIAPKFVEIAQAIAALTPAANKAPGAPSGGTS